MRFRSYILPSLASYLTLTALALMVIPRSRSISILSRSCSSISLVETLCVASSKRSAKVLLPWSMCAMIEKFRILSCLCILYAIPFIAAKRRGYFPAGRVLFRGSERRFFRLRGVRWKKCAFSDILFYIIPRIIYIFKIIFNNAVLFLCNLDEKYNIFQKYLAG